LVVPATVADARDLLIASVLCPDPVVFIDDRWLYDMEDSLPPVVEKNLDQEKPQCLVTGRDITLVASSYSVALALQASQELAKKNILAEVIDLRILNPFCAEPVVKSVLKTGRLLVIDGGWSTCGIAAEVIASVVESIPTTQLKHSPQRLTLPSAPAPASRVLESMYYPTKDMILSCVEKIFSNNYSRKLS
jgi:pyruvate dehydrogenase E1 component beta subunit